MSDKAKTFFPGQRKKMQMIATSTSPLVDKTGGRKIRLAVKMILDDGNLKGMPDWIGDTFTLVSKDNAPTDRSPINRVQLDGVNCQIFTTDTTKESSISLENCNLSAFVLTRGKDKKNGQLSGVDLHFTIKTAGWIPELWIWIGDNLNAVFWLSFAGTQIALSFKNEEEKEEPQGELIVESDFEKETQANIEKHFGAPVKSTGRMSKAKREASDKLSGKGPSLVN